MAGKINKWQMVGFRAFAPNVTKLTHIAEMFGAAPQRATDIMVQLYASNVRANGLNSLLSKYSTKYFDSDEEYTWDVIGNTRRNFTLVEARKASDNSVITASDTAVGANLEPITLVFDEPAGFYGEVLVGDFDLYPLLINAEPRVNGTQYEYQVELMAGNTEGMPGELLVAGKKFSREYAPDARELSRKKGGIMFTSPVAMRNEFSQIRLYDKVSGAVMKREVPAIAFGGGIAAVKTDANGVQHKVSGAWMTIEEWEIEKTWQEYKNNILAFGRSNRNKYGQYMNFEAGGEVIRMGSGLYEQLEVANTHYYTDFSLKLIEDVLYDLCAGKIDFKNRKFVLTTGEQGALLFNKAVLDRVSGWTLFNINADKLGVIAPAQSELNANALKAGYQFTEFLAPNGVHLVLNIEPSYDDVVRNKVLDKNGKPAMSSRFDIMDMGTDAQPNIFKVGVKGQEGDMRGYQWGPFRNPFTNQTNNPYASYDEDSAAVHLKATLGVCVLDPTRSVSLIPSELAGVF